MTTLQTEERPTAGSQYAIISADGHVGPAISELRQFVDPDYRDEFDATVAASDAMRARLMTDARQRDKVVMAGFLAKESLSDTGKRDAAMDAEGVVGEVLFANVAIPFVPLSLLGVGAHSDAPVSPGSIAAGARCYNRWLAEFCAMSPDRRAGVAVVPIIDIPATIKEVEFAAEQGLRGGIQLPPFMNSGFPAYNSPDYEPLWEACAANDIVLNSHGGGRIPSHFGSPEAAALIQAETHFFSRRVLWYLIFSGVFDRHPNLKLVFTEQLADWIPKTLSDLDSIIRNPLSEGAAAKLSLKPSEYWARNCYVGASFMSRGEAEVRHEIGVENIMWGSDYPHFEGTWPYTDQALRHTFSGIPQEEVGLMLGGNAARVFGFDLEKLAPLAARIGPRKDDLASPLPAPPEAFDRGFSYRTGQWG